MKRALLRKRQQEKQSAIALTRSPFQGLTWSPAFVAFLLYVISIETQRVQIGTITMGVAIVTLLLERGKLRFPAITLYTAGLILWACVGWATTEYPSVVAAQLWEMTKICAVIVVAVNVLTTRPRLRVFLVFLTLAFCAYPLRGTLLNYFGGITIRGRIAWNGIYSNPNDLAGLCLLQLALALGMLEVERAKWIRALAVGTALALPLIILLTQSRAAFIALSVFGIVAVRRYVRDLKRLGMMGVLIAVALFFAPDTVWKRLGTIGEARDSSLVTKNEAVASSAQRLAVWQVAIAIIEDHPFTGVGIGAYGNAHYVYSQSPRFDPLAHSVRDTHSTYLNLLAETGIIGFLCFIGLVFSTLAMARRTRLRLRTAFPTLASQLFLMELGAYGYLITGIWGSYGELVPTYLYFAVLYVTSQLLQEEQESSGLAILASSRTMRGQRPRTAVPQRV